MKNPRVTGEHEWQDIISVRHSTAIPGGLVSRYVFQHYRLFIFLNYTSFGSMGLRGKVFRQEKPIEKPGFPGFGPPDFRLFARPSFFLGVRPIHTGQGVG